MTYGYFQICLGFLYCGQTFGSLWERPALALPKGHTEKNWRHFIKVADLTFSSKNRSIFEKRKKILKPVTMEGLGHLLSPTWFFVKYSTLHIGLGWKKTAFICLVHFEMRKLLEFESTTVDKGKLLLLFSWWLINTSLLWRSYIVFFFYLGIPPSPALLMSSPPRTTSPRSSDPSPSSSWLKSSV